PIAAGPRLDAYEAAQFSSQATRLVPDAVNLEGPLAAPDLCVSHAGPGLAARALIAGVPLALLPMQLEQHLVGTRLVSAGVAVMIARDELGTDFASWLRAAAANDKLRETARAHAARLRDP